MLPSKLLVSIICILAILGFVAISSTKEYTAGVIVAACTDAKQYLIDHAFDGVGESLEARSVIVYDFTHKNMLYGKNESEVLPLASLTKLMTVRVALEQESKPYYTIKDEDLLPLGDIGMQIGQQYTQQDLAVASLVASSNDAAVALSHSASLENVSFISLMNTRAKRLGLSSLSFEGVTGLDTAQTTPTAVGNAKDILKLLYTNYTDYPALHAHTKLKTAEIAPANGPILTLENTNDALSAYPLLLAGKTGYTLSAGGNLAIVWKTKTGSHMGVAVLGSSQDDRFTDAEKLYRQANTFIESFETLTASCAL